MRDVDVCQKAMVESMLEISEHTLQGLFHETNTEIMLIDKNKSNHKLLFLFSSFRTFEKVISLNAPTQLIAIPEKAPSKAK